MNRVSSIEKRMAWWEAHGDAPRERTPTPRLAVETLFFESMGLAPADLPVVREDDDEIVWESRSLRPTLEACRRLNLDTRSVCRDAYEKSAQAFVSRVDPQLRFLRDYTRIRPFADHCQERIVRVSFEDRTHTAGRRRGAAIAARGQQGLRRSGCVG